MVTVSFETSNRSFFDGDADPDPYEVSRVLHVLSGLVLNGFKGGVVRDAEDNLIGEWKYTV